MKDSVLFTFYFFPTNPPNIDPLIIPSGNASSPTIQPEKIKDSTVAIKITNVVGFRAGVGPIFKVIKTNRN